MGKYEYIKCYWNWKFIDTVDPVILFYEIDLENERYASRAAEVYRNGKVVPVVWEGCRFVTEAPVPTVEEINGDSEFYAVVISKGEFEKVYSSEKYSDSVEFPEDKKVQ